ncbi:MAG: hypothetical protein HQK98_03830 [Nitrospirae bacterium]|nr:hypothetical protein [Nitrospirota bacterium]
MSVTPVSKYSSSDHYADSATGVLRNRLGITTTAELEEAEACFASARSYELSQNPLKGNFDLQHLKAIHGYYIEWKNVSRDEMIQASIASFQHGDCSKFLACIQANIRDF